MQLCECHFTMKGAACDGKCEPKVFKESTSKYKQL